MQRSCPAAERLRRRRQESGSTSHGDAGVVRSRAVADTHRATLAPVQPCLTSCSKPAQIVLMLQVGGAGARRRVGRCRAAPDRPGVGVGRGWRSSVLAPGLPIELGLLAFDPRVAAVLTRHPALHARGGPREQLASCTDRVPRRAMALLAPPAVWLVSARKSRRPARCGRHLARGRLRIRPRATDLKVDDRLLQRGATPLPRRPPGEPVSGLQQQDPPVLQQPPRVRDGDSGLRCRSRTRCVRGAYGGGKGFGAPGQRQQPMAVRRASSVVACASFRPGRDRGTVSRPGERREIPGRPHTALPPVPC